VPHALRFEAKALQCMGGAVAAPAPSAGMEMLGQHATGQVKSCWAAQWDGDFKRINSG